ncbi:unnamed protein product [Dovyalis caffra]|uniref:Beta-galactosidase n=1 Tax=Dovyalis caffra TaxID=77055 RepID=A0AAV1S6P6_9ROSI|nr:unnamed protein product [Dovyalis caffra]
MWPSLITKAKVGGIDVIQTYVFWNLHEPQEGQFYFSGRADIVRFVKEIQAQGLYACLRIGPFIESEWTYGGLPFWLHDIPGIVFRSDNQPFKYHMKRFVSRIVDMMKSENLYASQGGPIILSQVENEYKNVEAAFHEKGPGYVRWAAAMAVSLQTGVPWVMCKQDDAPDPVINSCNGMRCGETFAGPNSPNKPSIWTEDWTRNSGECAAFLVNNDKKQEVEVLFQSNSYKLPQKSISILPDCKTVTFNTEKVNAQYTTRSMKTNQKFNSVAKWEEYNEPIPEFDKTSLRENRLLEHMSTTKDTSDYLWYTFRFQQNLPNAQSVLNAQSRGHVLHAYVNGVHAGFGHGSHRNTSFNLQTTVHLKNGTNNVALLSATVGLPDSGAYLERKVAGLRRVRIQNKDFTTYTWGYQVGLLGERLQIYTEHGFNRVKWNKFGTYRPLMWYKTLFNAPAGNDPVALNLGSMGKGEAWVNGQSIGRYWVSFHTTQGSPSQTWYNVPRSFLKPTGNLLVLLEEERGYPPGITVDTVSVTKVCGYASESHLAAVHLSCPPRRNISRIVFASFGTPSGDCESYAIGNCHSSRSRANVEKACIGKRSCSIPQSNQFFGGDPCPGIPKVLLVEAKCR